MARRNETLNATQLQALASWLRARGVPLVWLRIEAENVMEAGVTRGEAAAIIRRLLRYQRIITLANLRRSPRLRRYLRRNAPQLWARLKARYQELVD